MRQVAVVVGHDDGGLLRLHDVDDRPSGSVPKRGLISCLSGFELAHSWL